MSKSGSETRRGIGSVDTAMLVLSALGRAAGPLSLKSLGGECQLPASQVHRYLASLIRAGYVRQHADTRNYQLGGAALNLGLAALRQLDIVESASHAVAALTHETGLTCLTAVWGDRGPTVIRWQRGEPNVVTSLGLGSVLPPLTSATGHVFMAFSPAAVTANAVRAQLNTEDPNSRAKLKPADVADCIARVRKNRLAWVDGSYIPGLSAISSPVLDAQGEAALAITLLSARVSIASPRHAAAKLLRTTCDQLSRHAGCPPTLGA